MTFDMREVEIEKYLKAQVSRIGGLCWKWTSPGMNGVPDRLVFVAGKCFPVELKAPGKKPTPLQLRVHQILHGVGFQVVVLDSKEAVNEFITRISA